jgi:hypothetical protein
VFVGIRALDTEPPRTPRKAFLIGTTTTRRIASVVPKKVLLFSVFSVARCRALQCFGLAAVLLAACSPERDRARTSITDDFGDTIVVGKTPLRVVSLNPATT